MRRYGPILILVALAVYLFLQTGQKGEPETAAIEKPTAKTANPAPEIAPAPSPPAAEPEPTPLIGQPIPAKQADERDPHKPPPNTVSFQLHGDLVVAFGDVLLGKPSREDFPERGYIEAPKVRPWKGGEIAFSLHPQLPNPERVTRVLAFFNENTAVRFVPYTNQNDSIVFSPAQIELCLSYVGKVGGHQPIYLDDRCSEREITHEVMHALGFIHEQSRPDRDQYVRIHWDKIEEDKQSQFEAAPFSMAEPSKNRPFDYQSIMIYEDTAFAKQRGDFTMQSLTGQKIEPIQNGISAEDFNRLQLIYSR